MDLPDWLDLISDTDLFKLADTTVLSVEFSPEFMAVFCIDQKLSIFSARSLKLMKVFNESIENFVFSQKGEIEMLKIPSNEI